MGEILAITLSSFTRFLAASDASPAATARRIPQEQRMRVRTQGAGRKALNNRKDKGHLATCEHSLWPVLLIGGSKPGGGQDLQGAQVCQCRLGRAAQNKAQQATGWEVQDMCNDANIPE